MTNCKKSKDPPLDVLWWLQERSADELLERMSMLAPDVFSGRSMMTRVWIMRCMMIKRVRLNGREAWDGVTGTQL